jgi:dienelactone hydrolase
MWLTPEHLHAYEFAWAPSSKEVVYVAAPPPGENTWWVAKLYSEWVRMPGDQGTNPEGSSGEQDTARLLFDPTTTPGPLHGLQIAVPRWSPDGEQIAFIGGLMSDQGSIGGDIYLLPAAGLPANTGPRNLTPNRPASPAWIEWRGPHSLIVSEHRGGSSHITAIDTEAGPRFGQEDPTLDLSFPETLIAGFDVMSLSTASVASGAPNGKFAVIRSSFQHPPEVWAGPLAHPDQLRQVSHLNETLKPQWGRAESVTWTHDKFNLQGWLLYPANYDPAKHYPVLVSVHGGPSSVVTPRWPEAAYGPVPFSALGYFVFMPNPRGSFGEGEAFTKANRKDFGYGDLSDILAGLDSIEQRLPIDKSREGITGWSYGGFMTMFAVTQTNRFHAAVAGAGISDWLSYYGENSIDLWMTPFFGTTVYDDPAIYARSSPISFIKNVKTPTLMVVGDRDGECPAPQSFEFWHGLRAQGVRTRLVVYPNEGHHFVDPEHKRDVLQRALEWFANAQ